jgi:hypothetical protein
MAGGRLASAAHGLPLRGTATLMRYYTRINAGRRRQGAADLAVLIAPAFTPAAEALSAA